MRPKSSLARNAAARPAALGVFIAVQVVAALYFAAEAFEELFFEPAATVGVAEAVILLALFGGVVFGAAEMLRALRRAASAEDALTSARGALADVVAARFDDWALTPAEREVALFALKGADIAEIARLRGAANGTVRAQLARIYAKAGVAGRAELTALFLDALLEGPLIGSETSETASSPTTPRDQAATAGPSART